MFLPFMMAPSELGSKKACVVYNIALDLFQALSDISSVGGPLIRVVSIHENLASADVTMSECNKAPKKKKIKALLGLPSLDAKIPSKKEVLSPFSGLEASIRPLSDPRKPIPAPSSDEFVINPVEGCSCELCSTVRHYLTK